MYPTQNWWLSNPNKWQDIALGDIAAKIIFSITAIQLTKHIAKFGTDNQCGSPFGKGCTDATFILKTWLQILRERQQEAHVLIFWPCQGLWFYQLLTSIEGIPDNLLIILMKLHYNDSYIMKVGEVEVEISGVVGVKQSDNLGPIFYFLFSSKPYQPY